MRLAILFLLSVLSASCGEPPVVKQTETLIDGLTATNKVNNWPTIGSLKKWSLSIDTFTDEVPSSTIEALYYRTCKKLKSLYGDKVKTYRWSDQMGYPGQATIVQFKNKVRGDSFLIARVFEANDNDSFSFAYLDGTYDVSTKKEVADWDLGNILRCNHESRTSRGR
jgi:hypothetical protein